jgi:HlyD family secretion protein
MSSSTRSTSPTTTLVAPRDGRIQYRIANIGEVLPAGGKVFTMLDISYVYMDIYLPTPEAGKVKVGTDARIVLDAYPNVAIPAKVSFVASQAQFTPKTVETQDERDKLMFRIRVRIDPERCAITPRRCAADCPAWPILCRCGGAWPARLQGSTPLNEADRSAPPGRAWRTSRSDMARWSHSTASRSSFPPAAWSG